MHYSARQRFWWIITWAFLITSFSLIGFLLVMTAMGFRYNPHTQRYQKTGMIIATNPPRESVLVLDGRKLALKPSTRIPNLLPGTYRLRVTKSGYLPWEKTVTVEPSFVVNLGTITLFRQHPIKITNNQHYLELLPYHVPDNQVRVIDNEIWLGTRLVSRFSEPISNALLWTDRNYIIYLKGAEIRAIGINGEHDQLLYTRQSTEATPFALIDGRIVVQDGAAITVLQID